MLPWDDRYLDIGVSLAPWLQPHLQAWLHQHCCGEWTMIYQQGYELRFERSDDAVRFSLTWM